eukprot:3197213-Amphidinium_carterae.1
MRRDFERGQEMFKTLQSTAPTMDMDYFTDLQSMPKGAGVQPSVRLVFDSSKTIESKKSLAGGETSGVARNPVEIHGCCVYCCGLCGARQYELSLGQSVVQTRRGNHCAGLSAQF